MRRSSTSEKPSVRLGDIAEFRNGVNFVATQRGPGVFVLNVKDFGDRTNPDYRNLETLKPSAVRAEALLLGGDTLFVRSNGNKELIGRSMHLRADPPRPTTHSAFTIRMRVISPEVDPLFCAYCVRGGVVRQTLSAQGSGTNISNLNQDILSNVKVWLPQLTVQRRIAGVLSAYDELIENNTRRIAILEEMARRIFEEWFVRFRAPGCEGARMIDTPVGPVPRGWSFATIGEVVQRSGGEVKTGPFGSQLHQSDYEREGIPVVMPTNLNDGRINEEGIARIGKTMAEKLSAHTLRAGDIVYGRRGDIGRKAFVGAEQDGWLCGTGCIRVSIRWSGLQPLYLHYYLGREDVRARIAGQAVGATMPNLNTSIINSVGIVLPPADMQQRFVAVVGDIDQLVRALLAQNTNLRTQRDLLLPKLISGETDVSETYAVKEAAE